MQVILSHFNLDFDGLASIIAAKKLFPKAVPILPEKQNAAVESFLGLYRDALALNTWQQVDWNLVDEVIMVDFADLKRAGQFANKIDPHKVNFTIYDHHPPKEEDIPFQRGKLEQIGANVTLLIEEIRKQNLPISSFEATLFALGVYTDTGYFSFLTTTPRDLQAGAFLLEQGANLSIIQQFISEPLDQEKQELFNQIMHHGEIFHLEGLEIFISTYQQKNFTTGLDAITKKVLDITGSDVLFFVLEMGNRIILVGRSLSPRASVLPIILAFQGGGHEKAASATIKNKSFAEVTQYVQDHLMEILKPAIRAKEIMTSPVKTVAPTMSIAEVAERILRYGHTGYPVTLQDKLVGIISRRDIEKAQHHGLGHAPVKGFMSTQPISISPEESLEEIQRIMMEKNIGRLPVVEDSQLKGIVTRSDVIRYLYGQTEDSKTGARHKPTAEQIVQLMKATLPEDSFELIQQIGEIADAYEYQVYLVGGIARDILLHHPNLDIDIVVEANGIQFAKLLAEKLGGDVKAHDSFGTATWQHPNGNTIDIATSRLEFYLHPAALPDVEEASLENDVLRRDFSINALAIHINQQHFGTLIDYFQGYEDIQGKTIRCLHNLSFVEDPTRIFRAIKFEMRYAFRMDQQTEDLARQAAHLTAQLSPTRIVNELRKLFQENDPLATVQRLEQLNLWRYLLPETSLTKEKDEQLKIFWRLFKNVQESQEDWRNEEIWFYIVTILSFNGNQQNQLDGFVLYQQQQKIIKEIQEGIIHFQRFFQAQAAEKVTIGKLHQTLHTFSSPALLLLTTLSMQQLSVEQRQLLQTYLVERKKIRLYLDGYRLQALGIKPGPIYKQIMLSLEVAYLDGLIDNEASSIEYVQNFINSKKMS